MFERDAVARRPFAGQDAALDVEPDLLVQRRLVGWLGLVAIDREAHADEPSHGRVECLARLLAEPVTPAFDDLVAARPDTVDGARIGRKNPAVEDGIPAAPGERGMRGVEGDDISARACLNSDGRLRERLGAAGQRGVEQRAAGRDAGAAGQHIALAMFEPLAIFELAQFVGDADQDIGIRADAEPAACVEEFAGRKNAVAKARFGDRAEACDGAAFGKRGDLGRGGVGRMDQAPALIDRRMFEQPLDRPPARPGDAFLDFPGLFGGVDMDRPAFGQRHDGRQFVRRHGPQAVRRDADIGSGQCADGQLVWRRSAWRTGRPSR